MASLSQLFKQNQKRNGIILGVFAAALIGAFLIFSQNSEPVKKEPKEKPTLHNVANEVEDKNLWMFKSGGQLEANQKKQDALSQEIVELKKEIKELKTAKLEQNKKELEHEHPSEPLVPVRKVDTNFDDDSTFTQPSMPTGSTPNLAMPQSPGILSVNLSPIPTEEKHLPHIDSYIPAGSYAKAVLLNGVDVSAGVSSQASPQPVLLKLIHKGSLPNKFFGKMKECRAIAAAYGDLSSERAYMRLEKLSCVQPDGHVIETDVDGYVSGHDGKNGIRGKVVIRDAEMLKRGFMGGVLSGLGKATSNSFSSTSVSPFGSVNTSTAKGAELFKQAGAQGTADAFELMARYNIQRAEQYQPVIQISANTKVEIVFHSGTKFGEQNRQQRRVANPLNNPAPASANQDFQSLLQQPRNHP